MTRKAVFVLFFLLVLASNGFALNFPKIVDYDIEIDFQPTDHQLTSKAAITFDQDASLADTICFYLHSELWVDSIKYGDEKIGFRQKDIYYRRNYSLVANQVILTLDDTTTQKPLTIFYSGEFNRSLTRSPSDYMRIDQDGVFLRSYGYSLWFPIFLESDGQSYPVNFSRVTISVQNGFHAIFAGNRISEKTVDGKSVSVWSIDQLDLIDAECTAYRWNLLNNDWLNIYYRDDSASTRQASAILEFANSYITKCNERFLKNRLPAQAYVLEMPRFGDISSGNVTGVAEWRWKEFDTDITAKLTLAHELIHPFVQIPIEQNDPLVAMVIEGFPSYFDHVILAEDLSEERFNKYLNNLEADYLKQKETGLSRRGYKLPEDKPLDQISYDDIGEYKDLFIIASRTSLMFNYFKIKMGADKYKKFERELFDFDKLTDAKFRQLVIKYQPDLKNDLDIWLSSIDYPQRFHLDQLTGR